MNRSARGPLDRLRRLPPWLQDLGLAVLVWEADLIIVLTATPAEGPLGVVPRWVAAVVTALAAAPLVARRRAPELVMVWVGLGTAAAAALGVELGALGPVVALYTVAAYSSLRETVIATSVFLAITVGLLLQEGLLPLLYANSLIVIGVAVLGRIIQAHRAQAVELAARARELERSREDRARLAVQAERARIAREVHDVLAHSTSVMVVQATGAGRLLKADPARAEQALQVIAATGRETLAELRRSLGLLRTEEPAAPTSPQPGLGDVRALVAEFAASGLPVVLRTDRVVAAALDGAGMDAAHTDADRIDADRIDAAHIDAGIALAAYRIVQEALTNALKHADAERVLVDLRHSDGALVVEVLDDGGRGDGDGVSPHAHRAAGGDGPTGGHALRATGGGFGLVGMRERAEVYGGHLEVGPRPGGGFRVAVRLPLDEQADRGVPAAAEPAS